MCIDEIKTELDNCFESRKYPGDNDIALTRPFLASYEGNKVFGLLKGKDWKYITSDYLLNNYPRGAIRSIPAFLTKKGFEYYLPAFLLLVLENFEEWRDLSDAICFYLTSNDDSATLNFSNLEFSNVEKSALCKTMSLIAKFYSSNNLKLNPALMFIANECSDDS